MGTNNQHMDPISEELWQKYFSGELTSMQKRNIQHWISNPDNQDEYYKALDNWERSNIQFTPDVNNAVNRFEALIHQNQSNKRTELTENPPSDLFTLWHNNWFRAVAAVFIIGVSVFLLQLESDDYTSYTTAEGEVRTIHLADQSTVLLNENSELRLPDDFESADIRNIYLDGNARFNVKHTVDNKKFVVTTSHDCRIEVLGTEFDVFSTKDSSRIYLKSGSIRLFAPDKRDVILVRPDDVVNIAKDNAAIVQPKQKYWQYKAWEEHQFVFNGTTMEEISIMLEKQFKMKIIIRDDVLKSKAISGTYQWKEAQDILYILSDILNFRIEEENNNYILKYKN